ncbi:MAG TPA: CHAD domain-containing protein [Polyangia bacterium]|nr:CHAD domain-containing protein [Polyangia bacterium]
MAKPWKVEGITASTPAREAAAELIAMKLGELRHHAQHAVERTDPEDTHAVRVASRRLRATLGLLGGPLEEFREGVKRLGRILGEVRDHDVLLAWLADVEARAESDELPGIARLREQRQAELPALEAMMREAVGAFEVHVAQPLNLRLGEAGWPGRLGGGRARRHLSRRLKKLGRQIEELEAQGLEQATPVHQLRIAGKKARYELELMEGVLPPAEEALDRLKTLQEIIGELHDADVRIAFLPHYLVGVPRAEQSGVVRLLKESLLARGQHAARLAAELPNWQSGDTARLLARQLRHA